MPGITGQSTTYNMPNFVGELFEATPGETPLLSTIGGLTGGKGINATVWTWQVEDLRDADKNRQRLEGADAPNAEARTRSVARNVLEIHQESVNTSYTKSAATGQFASTGSSQTNAVGITGANPVLDEHGRQTMNMVKQVARDVEKTFTNGLFQEPTDNTTPRKTKGLMQATTTNVSDQGTLVGNGASTIATNGTITETTHGLVVGDWVVARVLTTGAVGVLDDDQLYYVKTAPDANTFTLSRSAGGATITFTATGVADFYKAALMTEGMFLDLAQLAWENGGLRETETRTIMCNARLRRLLTKIFITDKNYQEGTRNVGGVNLQTIGTDFGEFNIMLTAFMPTGALEVVSLEDLSPVFMEIPGKGHFFIEPLAKTGSSDKDQLYGEIGLEWGNERKHAKLLGVR